MGIFLLLPGNHQDMSQGAKGEKEQIKCCGCGVGCQQDEGETGLLYPLLLQQGCRAVRCFWNVSGIQTARCKGQSWSSSCVGSALMGALTLQEVHVSAYTFWRVTSSHGTKRFVWVLPDLPRASADVSKISLNLLARLLLEKIAVMDFSLESPLGKRLNREAITLGLTLLCHSWAGSRTWAASFDMSLGMSPWAVFVRKGLPF